MTLNRCLLLTQYDEQLIKATEKQLQRSPAYHNERFIPERFSLETFPKIFPPLVQLRAISTQARQVNDVRKMGIKDLKTTTL